MGMAERLNRLTGAGAPTVPESMVNGAVSAMPGAHAVDVSGLRAGQAFAGQDWLADEVPVALEFNGVSHAVMLATPLDLEDFALGFALSEGILQSSADLYSVDEEAGGLGITLKMQIAASAFDRLKRHRRSMTGRTGCGLCGTESLSQVARPLRPLPPPTAVYSPGAIARAMAELGQRQVLQKATGAVHAAAWCDRLGQVIVLREDVGRHNALDKVIGALARKPVDASDGFMAVTSRASFEMVQKTASAGVPMLAAVSAATTYAVSTALEAGLTLVGFARGGDYVAYTHPERLAPLPTNRAYDAR
jgi:FdhD protein